MFSVKRPAISKHIKNIFESGELIEDSVVSILETTAKDSQNHNIICCNRDMIIVIRTLKTRIVTDKKDSKESFKSYGAGDGSQLDPKTDIYLEIIKELTHSSTVIFDIKSILKSNMK